jgi:uncharacterized protein (DUF433 family)
MAAAPAQNVVLSAFTEEQAEKLTGISRRQLRYWDATGFFAPSYASEDRRLAFSRLYSFRDIASLKVLNALRNEAKVSLPHLRDVREKLSHLGDDLWAKTTLYVVHRRVVFHNPETDRKEEVLSGQGILQIPLQVISGDLERAVKDLWRRDKKAIGKVERQRGRAQNQPVVAGTRIPVRALKAFSDAGYSILEILKEYPSLTEKDVKAALKYEEAA